MKNTKQNVFVRMAVVAGISAIVVSGATSHAGVQSKSFKQEVAYVEDCRFRDMEFQIDTFYTGFLGSSGSHFKSGSGGGFGFNFFFARYFGIGYEAAWYGNGGTAEHMPLSGNLFLRYPICSLNLAPYLIVGGGAAWDGNAIGFGNVGAGLEYRFTNNIGIFVDSRYFYGGTGNVGNLRGGLRLAF
jgi:opacity protein-like surface antigen